MEKKINNITIIGNGEDYSAEKVISYCQKADYIIAADGGNNTLHQLNIRPHLIIGDFDSTRENVLAEQNKNNGQMEKIKTISYPRQKDYSDSELALQKAISIKPENIFLLAMTGSYFDHSLANIINLFRNREPQIDIKMITQNSTIFPIFKKKVINRMQSRRCSFFVLDEIVNLKTQGFQYNFPQKNISSLDYSLSNCIISDKASIEFEQGKLFFILFDENYR